MTLILQVFNDQKHKYLDRTGFLSNINSSSQFKLILTLALSFDWVTFLKKPQPHNWDQPGLQPHLALEAPGAT